MINSTATKLFAIAVFTGAVAITMQDARARDAEVEIKGQVQGLTGSCPNLVFTVAQQRVVTHAGTEFEDGSCAEVRNGRRVEAEGALRGDGALVARKLELK
jgi:hypothetical protein